jgi:hypothetical protein
MAPARPYFSPKNLDGVPESCFEASGSAPLIGFYQWQACSKVFGCLAAVRAFAVTSGGALRFSRSLARAKLRRESEIEPVEAAVERAVKFTEAGKFRPGVSGNPLGGRYLKDQAAALFATISADLGPLSPTDEILLRQACLLFAKSTRIAGRNRANVDVAVRLHSEARRTITSLRRRLQKSKASAGGLDGYLEAKAAQMHAQKAEGAGNGGPMSDGSSSGKRASDVPGPDSGAFHEQAVDDV